MFTTGNRDTGAANAAGTAPSARLDFGPMITAWDAVVEDFMQNHADSVRETRAEGVDEIIMQARTAGATAAVKDVTAAAAATILATVGIKATNAIAATASPGDAGGTCPSRTLQAVVRAADRIERLEVLLADVLGRAVRSEAEAEDATERSNIAMQVSCVARDGARNCPRMCSLS